MKKSHTYKYTLILILLLLGVIFRNYLKLTRNLQLSENSPVEFNYFLAKSANNCVFQSMDGFRFFIRACQSLSIGEYYTIIGRVKPVSASEQNWQINIDVSKIAKQNIPVFSLKFIIKTLYQRIYNFTCLVTGRLSLLLIQFFDQEVSHLITGLTLGTKFASFPREFTDLVRSLGLSHMVAVSGFHLNLVFGLVYSGLAKFLSKRSATLVTILVLLWYAIIVSSPLSLVRALIMLIFTLIGRNFLGKCINSLYGLFLSFLLMASFSFLNVLNVGWQLSFLATAGIIMFGNFSFSWSCQILSLPSPFLAKLRRLWSLIVGSFQVSLSAQILAWPVLVNTFGELAPSGPLSTLLFSSLLALLVSFSLPLLALGTFSFSSRFLLLLYPYFSFLNDAVAFFLALLRMYATFFGGLWTIDFRFNFVYFFVYFLLIFAIFLFMSGRRARPYHYV